jgi:ATP-dependent helicase/nuclease subunit B
VIGRIDRIDRHADGRWFIFDYKTGDSSTDPEKAHRHDGEWIDLQLPLYRHIARSLGVGGDVQLGYLRLPRDTSDIGEKAAAWTAEDLASADQAIMDVATCIRNGVFWKQLDDEPSVLTEYGPICQDGVLERELTV